MTKKIEIHPTLASNIAYHTLYRFTNDNSNSGSGSCKLYLMSGEAFDSDGYYPKNFNLSLPYVNGPYPLDAEIVFNSVKSFTPGTYTVTVTVDGQTITASIDATENLLDNFQILSRSGNKGLGSNSFIFPFQIPSTIIGDSGEYNANIDITATTIPSSNYRIVEWKNNRVKANYDNYDNAKVWLSTYAAVASNSGTATWFYGENTNYNLWFVGTVGLTGSGADLELDDVNIVQGKTYGISNLRIQVPTSFTY